jgi:hypothetical protein
VSSCGVGLFLVRERLLRLVIWRGIDWIWGEQAERIGYLTLCLGGLIMLISGGAFAAAKSVTAAEQKIDVADGSAE